MYYVYLLQSQKEKDRIKRHETPSKSIVKKNTKIVLQIIVVTLGMSVLAFMLWEPHLEGRNAHTTLFEIYFKDPFLAYAYIASTPFFVAVYQVMKLIGYIEQDKIFSQNFLKTVQTIKYCAMAMVALIAAPEVYLLIAQPSDDIAGGVAIGFLLMFISLIVATIAKIYEQILKNTREKNYSQ